MDNIEDNYLTNLSWLKFSNISELQSTVDCNNNYIDDDLQCLCWIPKIRPSHSVKRLSDHHNRSLNGIRNSDDNKSKSQQIMILRTLSPMKTYILIRLSNGKISCLSIRHFI